MRLLLIAFLIGSLGLQGPAVDKMRLVLLAAIVLLSVKHMEVRRECRRLFSEAVPKEPPDLELALRSLLFPYPHIGPPTITVPGEGGDGRDEDPDEGEAASEEKISVLV